jgi:NAD(P)-dependent dehydrogenase (short-subunit alcohol dehydrogenase family)
MALDFGLGGKVVVVTGGGAGIARAVVETFIDEGAKVVTADRDTSPLAGLEVEALELDLLDPTSPQKLVDRAVELHGTVDVLVNALGGLVPKTNGFTEITEEDWDWTLNFNLRVMIRTTRAVLPVMVENGGGSIVTIASDQSRQPDPIFVEYAAAKAGVLSVAKAISIEYADRGIRSNSIAPGPCLTPGLEGPLSHMAEEWGVSTEEAIDRFVKEIREIPIGRIGQPQDVANVVAFLASDLASNVTGSEYCTDGGIKVAM